MLRSGIFRFYRSGIFRPYRSGIFRPYRSGIFRPYRSGIFRPYRPRIIPRVWVSSFSVLGGLVGTVGDTIGRCNRTLWWTLTH